MGLAKHFYTARGHGERVPDYVYRFFGDGKVHPAKETPRKKKAPVRKPRKKQTNEEYVTDMLKDLLG